MANLRVVDIRKFREDSSPKFRSVMRGEVGYCTLPFYTPSKNEMIFRTDNNKLISGKGSEYPQNESTLFLFVSGNMIFMKNGTVIPSWKVTERIKTFFLVEKSFSDIIRWSETVRSLGMNDRDIVKNFSREYASYLLLVEQEKTMNVLETPEKFRNHLMVEFVL